jgi:hypothetical protein
MHNSPLTETIAVPVHNHANLTEWGQNEGYRLLDEDEVHVEGVEPTWKIELWMGEMWLPFARGNTPELIYRTKLTRAELAAERGIGAATETTYRVKVVTLQRRILEIQAKGKAEAGVKAALTPGVLTVGEIYDYTEFDNIKFNDTAH